MTPSPRAERAARIALVTAGLSLTGGIVGAVCGAVAVAIIAGVEGGLAPNGGILVGLAAGAGAVAGMIGAPALAWGVLRRVPLGRAMLVTAMGTVAGAICGEFFNPLRGYADAVPGVIAGAFGGFVVAGIGLRIATRGRTTSALPSDPSEVSERPG